MAQGFDTDVEWTVESWKTNQGFDEYEEGRQEWLEILLKQGLKGALEVDAQVQALLPTILYDLDTFRQMICDPISLRAHGLDGSTLEYLKTNDLALLKFSYNYLQSVLFAEGAGLIEEAS